MVWCVCILFVVVLYFGRSCKGEVWIWRLYLCFIFMNNVLGYWIYFYFFCGYGIGGFNRVFVLWIKEWGGEVCWEVIELWRVVGCGMCGKEYRNCYFVVIKFIEDWDLSVVYGEGVLLLGDVLWSEILEYYLCMYYIILCLCCYNCRLWFLLLFVLFYMYVWEYM